MTPSSALIDLRSDTVTRPTQPMRVAMAAAPVGDDQFGEDPSVNALQERLAGLFAKEAALWLPSGTMANQVALRVLTQPGDDVMVPCESHLVWHEKGAGAAHAGVQFTEIGARGVFTADECAAAVKPPDHLLYPPTTLVAIEDTHNRCGGVIFPHEESRRICAWAKGRGLSIYLDGARLWNTSVASGRTVAELSTGFDLTSVALSKGLGAPAGSVLLGTRSLIGRAGRFRRMLGGAMRQVGILAAAGLYALDHHLARLAEDHANARRMAERIARSRRILLEPAAVQTNIIVFEVTEEAPDAPTVVERALARGVRILAFGPRTVRAVTHLDVSADQCAAAADVIAGVVDG